MNNPGTALAVDIGGTKILLALVSGTDILDERLLATERSSGADAWISTIADVARDWRGSFRAVGAAVTGYVEDGCWSALNPGTLAIPPRYPLVDRLSEALGAPVTAINDAQAAAWGEYRHGAGEGEDMVFLTISTGIGGGIVANGSLLNGLAGHFGLWPDEAGGMLEDGASGRWITAEAQRLGYQVEAAPDVFRASEVGAGWATDILDRSADRIALLCRCIQLALGPRRIVIGGGVGLARGTLQRLESRLAQLDPPFRPHLVAAKLGARAGVIGAADLALAGAHSPGGK